MGQGQGRRAEPRVRDTGGSSGSQRRESSRAQSQRADGWLRCQVSGGGARRASQRERRGEQWSPDSESREDRSNRIQREPGESSRAQSHRAYGPGRTVNPKDIGKTSQAQRESRQEQSSQETESGKSSRTQRVRGEQSNPERTTGKAVEPRIREQMAQGGAVKPRDTRKMS